jgi:MFS family permease
MNKASASTKPVGSNALLRAFSSLRIKNYRWYWIGLVSSMMAMQMQILLRGWLVYDMTDSPLLLGLVTGAAGIPMILITPIGGVIADRYNKRNLIIIAEAVACLNSLAVSLLILTDTLEIWHLFVTSLIAGTAFAVNMPARQAIIGELVGESQLMNGITLNSVGATIGRILGPSLAGVLAGFIGMAGAYILTTVLYAFVVYSMMTVILPQKARPEQYTHPLKDLSQGLQYTYRNRLILVLIVMSAIVVLLGMSYTSLLPIFARDIFSMGPAGLGLLTSAVAIGALAGSLMMAFIGNLGRKGLYLIMSTFTVGIGLIIFAFSQNFFLSCLFLLLVGVATSVGGVLNNTMVQIAVEPRMRGRILSLFVMTFGLLGIGSMPLGALAEVAGAPLAVAASGILLALCVLIIALAFPKIRQE